MVPALWGSARSQIGKICGEQSRQPGQGQFSVRGDAFFILGSRRSARWNVNNPHRTRFASRYPDDVDPQILGTYLHESKCDISAVRLRPVPAYWDT